MCWWCLCYKPWWGCFSSSGTGKPIEIKNQIQSSHEGKPVGGFKSHHPGSEVHFAGGNVTVKTQLNHNQLGLIKGDSVTFSY